MSISRRLPSTNIGRFSALDAAKRKLDSTDAADIVLSANTISRLNILYPLYKEAYETRTAVLGIQTSATEAANQDRSNSRTYISHFVQVFNLGVERKKYPAEHRSFYGLGINNGSVPTLTAEADILLWGNNLIKGDAKRLAAGGEPMSNPSIAELETVYNKMLQSIDAQSSKKDTYDKAQEALETLNPEADKLILRIWNEIDTAYDEHEAASRRRKAREWGVVYSSITSIIALTGVVLNALDNSPIAQAKVHLLETDTSSKTDAAGLFSINTNIVGKVTLVVQKLGFANQTIELEVEENKALQIEVLMNKI